VLIKEAYFRNPCTETIYCRYVRGSGVTNHLQLSKPSCYPSLLHHEQST